MTDEELARYLAITLEELRMLTPADRERYENVAITQLALAMWLDGKGPRPKGVIICERRKKSAARKVDRSIN